MNRFTNENLKRAYRIKVRTIIIGIFILLLAVGFLFWAEYSISATNKDIKDFGVLLGDKSEKNKEDKKVYLNVATKPYKFAIYDDTTDAYYMVADKAGYLYVVYMSTDDYNKLNTEKIVEEPIKIEGLTKIPPKDVKELAIEAYNDGLEDAEKLQMVDYNNYFGEVYLDLTVTDSYVATVPICLFLLSLMFGSIMLIVGVVELVIFKKTLGSLDATIVDEIDKEMNDPNAFYYQKANLFLTEHYIINFGGKVKIIRYSDILWMYRYEQRTNGIKTAQSIKVLTTNGKTSSIANLDLVTKKAKDAFDEIWNTILEKNPTMLVGYTAENLRAMKEKVKEIKRESK